MLSVGERATALEPKKLAKKPGKSAEAEGGVGIERDSEERERRTHRRSRRGRTGLPAAKWRRNRRRYLHRRGSAPSCHLLAGTPSRAANQGEVLVVGSRFGGGIGHVLGVVSDQSAAQSADAAAVALPQRDVAEQRD